VVVVEQVKYGVLKTGTTAIVGPAQCADPVELTPIVHPER
jgi:hypothetical protein